MPLVDTRTGEPWPPPNLEAQRQARVEQARKVVASVAAGLLRYPDKTLIPWTEWADLRSALASLDELEALE